MDEATGVFVNLKTGDHLPLSDAVEAGLVTAEYQNGQEPTSTNGGIETKTYAVNSVVDQVRESVSVILCYDLIRFECVLKS